MRTKKTHDPNPMERLLSRRQLSGRWSCCVETLKRMEKQNVLRAIRFNRRFLRYRLADILAIEAEAGGGK
jgi:hypothetical protein